MRLRIREANLLDVDAAARHLRVSAEDIVALLDAGTWLWLVVDDDVPGSVHGVARADAAGLGAPTLLELVDFTLSDEAWGTDVGDSLLLHVIGDADCHTAISDDRARALLERHGFVPEGGLLVRREPSGD